MDYGKHVAFASFINLAIMALGFTAFYVGWITLENRRTFVLHNQFEHILVARNTLVERLWNDGAEVTVKSLIDEVDRMLSLFANVFPVACKTKTPPSCEDEEAQRSALFGLTVKEMQLKLPQARRFELTGVRSEYETSCNAIFFRGKDEETFWINGISKTVAAYQVQGGLTYSSTPGTAPVPGSLIYYVRPSSECRFSPGPLLAPGFFLIDLRSIGKGWNFHAQDDVIQGIYDEEAYRMLMENFKETEGWRKANFPKFEISRFFEQLPIAYRKRFVADVPSGFFTVPVTGIESRILGTAYIKTGALYNSSEMDKALLAAYSFEKFSPQVLGIAANLPPVGGVATNLKLFISIAPIILLAFSFLFWYHVKRIVRSSVPYNSPWIFLDAEGLLEKGFVTVWAALLVLTPASITWALLVIYEAFLPRIGQILAWVRLNRDPVAQAILDISAVSVPATLGGIVIVVAELLIVHSLHLLLKRGSVTYSRFCTSIKSWLVKLVPWRPRAWRIPYSDSSYN